jgi:putative transposase
MGQYEMSERHACRLVKLARSTHRYRSRRRERDAEVRARLKELAAKRNAVRVPAANGDVGARRGRGQSQACVPAASGGRLGDAHSTSTADPLEWNASSPAAVKPHQRWSIDFVSDCVSTGKVIRMLTMVDDFNRECPAIEVDTSLGGLRVRRVVDSSGGGERSAESDRSG